MWKHNEHRQIRRIVHDLKQPVALLMLLTEEDDMDRALVSSICLSLCRRVKSINVSLTSSLIPKDYTLFDIHDMMFNLTKDYSRLFTVRTVDLKFKSTIVKPLIVLALRDNLEYAVENLLSNANKFVHDGGTVTVSLSFKNIDTNKVIIKVMSKRNRYCARVGLRGWS